MFSNIFTSQAKCYICIYTLPPSRDRLSFSDIPIYKKKAVPLQRQIEKRDNMTAKELANVLLAHPDKEVYCGYGGALTPSRIEYNGRNFFITSK